MRDDGVGRDEEVVGYLLVCHTLHYTDDNILLTLGQFFLTVAAMADHCGNLGCDIALTELLFKQLYGGNEDMVFHLCMLREPFFVIIDVI